MTSIQHRVVCDLKDALGSSLDIHEVMQLAYPLLLEAVGAEHASLGITAPGQRDQFEWLSYNLPPAFFEGYAEMAPHDFVLRAVVGAPKLVLRDSEMVTRAELESNVMHRRARDLGRPLEHVMAVMLQANDVWSGGLALYRSRRRPFSDRDRAVLQELTPALTNAVRNCRLFAEVARRALPEPAARGAELPQTWSRLLTPREREVTRCIAAGWDNRLIGEELGCAEATVKAHASNIFDKLGVSTRAQLIARAHREGR